MREIVEKSLISANIKSNPKNKYINWCDQLCALVNLITLCWRSVRDRDSIYKKFRSRV